MLKNDNKYKTNEEYYEALQKKSLDNFYKVVKPVLDKNNINVLNIEQLKMNYVQKIWDHGTGIDLFIINKKGLIPCSLRIQTNKFNTFTIRYQRHNGVKTEYDKLKERKENGMLAPTLMIQCYIYDSNITIGIAKVDDVLNVIENGNATLIKMNCNSVDGVDFYAIPFDKVECIILKDKIA